MFLVAQRVVSHKGIQGINARCYLHGEDRIWIDVDGADHGRGELVQPPQIEVPGRGNRIRSYLDILAPDITDSQRIWTEVVAGAEFLAAAQRRLPWELSHGDIKFTFEAERSLAREWQVELSTLLRYALRTRPGNAAGGILAGRNGILG